MQASLPADTADVTGTSKSGLPVPSWWKLREHYLGLVATCGRMATHEWNIGVAALDEGDASTWECYSYTFVFIPVEENCLIKS